MFQSLLRLHCLPANRLGSIRTGQPSAMTGLVPGNRGILHGFSDEKNRCMFQWIGLRENLQETMVFTIKYRVFL
jgi:hypothetical protein